MRTTRFLLLMTWLTTLAGAGPAAAGDRLLRFPDLSADRVAFVYAGDIWVAPRAGGTALRLTAHPGQEWFPKFSPDGRQIAFTADYDGNREVYAVAAGGGEPRRLTWSADIGPDVPERFGPDNAVLGWSPGGDIVYRSRRQQWNVFMGRPWLVSPDGGPPRPLPLPWSGLLSFAPDGRRIAYNPTWREFRTWKRYRGGMAQDIHSIDLDSGRHRVLVDSPAVDDFPMWHESGLYFVSERSGRAQLYRRDAAGGEPERLTDFADFDVKWPSLGPDAIVFEHGGRLKLYSLDGGRVEPLAIDVPADKIRVRPRLVDAAEHIEAYWLAPDGARVLFVARGELFTVPAEHGPTRNLTRTPGARERGAMWSPDGRWIAYLSDASGEVELWLRDQTGRQPPRQLTEAGAGYRFQPVWSPDSNRLAFADEDLRLWWFDLETEKLQQVDVAERWEIREYAWSADSRWLAYAKTGANGFGDIWLYDTEQDSRQRLTSPMFDDGEPVFDPAGRYLYFLSARDFHASLAPGLESNFIYARQLRPFALQLRPDVAPPFAPRSDETVLPAAGKPDKSASRSKLDGKGKKRAGIVLDGLSDRLSAFPVERGNLSGLRAGAERVFWIDAPLPTLTGEPRGEPVLRVFDLAERELAAVHQPVDGFELSADGRKLVYHSGDAYYLVDAKAEQAPDDEDIEPLDLSGMRILLDPRAEWRQMFFEAWRLMRDFFYAPNMHGRDWAALRDRYAALLPAVAHRIDLTYLIGEMIGELGAGHAYVGGGDLPAVETVSIGLLGTELEPDPASGRWRIGRIFQGQNWDADRRSPLTEPGVEAHAGDYLLAIDGRELRLPDVPGQLLLDRAGRQTALRLNRIPSASGAWTTVVVPLERDAELRYGDWVQRNRRRVDEASDGRVGYIHLPDMAGGGLNAFARTFYPQLRKQALIIDVRWNGGGFVSQMIIERLRRELGGMTASRNAGEFTYPDAVQVGPKVCLINQWSASDGDLFPHFFRRYGLGRLVGKRTWGGVVGIRGDKKLVDGGYLYQPEFAYYDLDSSWMIENRGVEPDVEVDLPPAAALAGRDPQLERAIEMMLEAIAAEPPRLPPRPADPSDR